MGPPPPPIFPLLKEKSNIFFILKIPRPLDYEPFQPDFIFDEFLHRIIFSIHLPD